MNYKTETYDNHDGTATIGTAYVQRKDGTWTRIGTSKAYATYPRFTRARTAARNMCIRHWRSLPFDVRIGAGYTIQDI